jgi:hypothetical protein
MIRQLLSEGGASPANQPMAILELDRYLQAWHFSGEYLSARDNLRDEGNRRQNC